MFQKIVFQTKEAKALENYKGKKVVVHAVRPNLQGGFQKFRYEGVISKDLKEPISIALGYFLLDADKVQLNCNFVVSEKAKTDECFVMSVEDAETQKTLYENKTSLKFCGPELEGNVKLEGFEQSKYLNKFNGTSAVLLAVYKKGEQDYAEFKVSNNLTFFERLPKDFKLKTVKTEVEENVL